MKKVVCVSILVILLSLTGWSDTLLCLWSTESKKDFVPLPAFPGAKGFGAYTQGGRGGEILVVTNLNDHGQGSLRKAIETPGPRIIVFKVSGTIYLEYRLKITEPYITIAGQTAPGDGICLAGGQLTIETHDVIVRYLRIRPGDINPIEEWDGISIRDRNVIIDHCSASWSIDEVLSPTMNSNNITIQWCIVSEPLHNSFHHKGPHGYISLIRPSVNNSRISLHHNLFAHGYRRFPAVGTYETNLSMKLDLRNNVVYNWGDKCGYSWSDTGPLYMNIIGNYYQAGLDTEEDEYNIAFDGANSEHYIYQEDNIMNEQDLGWDMIRETYTKLDYAFEIEGIYTVKTDDVYEAYDRVLDYAGAVFPKRDEVDGRVVQSVRDGTGQIIDSQDEVGGWPVLYNESPPVDTDMDGMPDDWEEAHNLDPEDSSDATGTDLSPRGYTNIEIYINSLAHIK